MRSNNRKFEKIIFGNLKHRSFIISFIVSLLLISSLTTFVVKADDLIVDDDGAGPYLSIQDAIDASSPGDTIIVKDGTYSEALTINVNNLTIIANNGDEPIIYLTSYSPGINIQASNVLFEGFKIYGNANPGGGPVISLTSSADGVIIRDNIFKVVTGETGNAVLITDTGSENGRFVDNTVQNYDVGIELSDGSNIIVSSTFSNVNQSISHGSTIAGTSTWYGTIQDAIDLSGDGDTVEIVEGTFNENLQINKSITLKGKQSGDNPTNGRPGGETVLDGGTTSPVRISAYTDNVTIDGLSLTIASKDSSSNQAGVLMEHSVENISIKNNIIQDITDGSGDDTINDESYGIMVYGKSTGSSGQKDIWITNNLIRNVEEYGIAINDNTSRVTITGNKITELIGSDHNLDPYWMPSWPLLICSAIHLGGQVGPIDTITIENNILTTNQTGDGTVTVAGSGISFGGVAEWPPGVRPWNGFKNININDNIISKNSRGIVALTGYGNGSVEVHDNNISGNSEFAIYNSESSLHFDATNNWWGDITGPYNITENPDGLGETIIGNVTFWPWYEFETGSIPPFVDYDVEGPQENFGEIIKEETEIELNAIDNESGLLSLTYRIWNTTHRWGPWTNYTGPFTLPGQGEHRVQYNATDVAGTSTYFSPLIYTEHRVDDVAPVIEVLYPNGGEYEYDSIPISWKCSDRIFDQGQLQRNDSISLTEDYPGHVQSFLPTQGNLQSVQLLLNGMDANISVKIMDELSPVPNVIGQSSKRITNIGSSDNPEWVRFDFDSAVDLDTSETYYLGVTILENFGDDSFKWHYFDDSSIDNYPYGHAWIKETDSLTNMSTMDFGFKTLYWDLDVDVTIQYSNTGGAPWSTIAANEDNDGSYSWDSASYGIPDGPNYKINLLAKDKISNIGFDDSDDTFLINNDGSAVLDVQIVDTTISNEEYTKNGDSVEVSATIVGDPEEITADLSSFGKGSSVPPTSFTGGIAKWTINDILCSPSNGEVSATITAVDATGDTGSNTGSIISDNTNPFISITKPRAGLYFLDGMRILPFSYPFIIGQITFEIDANDNGSGINNVEFYLENELESSVSEPPYHWTWDQAATGFFDVEIVIYDNVGHEAFEEIKDLFIINLDIIGHN